MTESTLQLIARRGEARRSGDTVAERNLAKSVRKSVARDRANWLEKLTADGNWGEVRKVRKDFVRCKDASGTLPAP